MSRRCFAVGFCLLGSLGVSSAAAEPRNPQWVWVDEANPAVEAPARTAWFRKELRASEPSTGLIRIAADDKFTLWVNGEKVGEGDATKLHRFNLNGLVGRGLNVIAVEATNSSGKAGLYVNGEIRGQSGRPIPFDSAADWKVTTAKPEGDAWKQSRFDEAAWKPVRVIAAHDASPWKAIDVKETYLDRFSLAQGLELERIGEPNLMGQIICFTWGNRGRIIASQNGGPIYALIDENKDGKYEKAVRYSRKVVNCQGLLVVGDDLYAVGDGPGGTGVYILPDKNHDDQADEVKQIVKHKGGMGEHGPHDVVLGPDGWLYHNLGNHSWVTEKPQPTSPANRYEEGNLLVPPFEDANGHAVGLKAPGGTVWRLSPDGKRWWTETVGFRNHYDIGFNAAGDLFTFDSDMEWDVGAPWYKPVRVNHCTAGAEFGWRSGAPNWPAYYFDSLPTTVDVGRGSPTGVMIYEHEQLPEKYKGSLLLCDWSVGRLIAAKIKPQGASYAGDYEVVVGGNPLNICDIDVDRDGSIVFSTGGRGTEGGLYRVRTAGSKAPPKDPPAETIDDCLKLSQIHSGWAREAAQKVKTKLGPDAWLSGMVEKTKTGSAADKVRVLTLLSQLGPKPTEPMLQSLAKDVDPEVRQFSAWLLGDHPSPATAATLTNLLSDPAPRVRRRACEAFVRAGLTAPTEPLISLLTDSDPWVRFASRLTLERCPIDQWKGKVMSSSLPWISLQGLLALHRVGNGVLPPEAALAKELELLKKCAESNDPDQTIAAIRMIQLTLMDGGKGETADQIGKLLLEKFLDRDEPSRTEAARVVCWLSVPGAGEKLIGRLASPTSQALQIHYALCLRYMKSGWTRELKGRLLDWYESTREWEGGDSFVPFLANIVGATLEHYDPADRAAMLQGWSKRPFATRLLLRLSSPKQIDGYEVALGRMIDEILAKPSLDASGEMTTALIDSLGKTGSEEGQVRLRKLYDGHADFRDAVARVLAKHPSDANWPYLVKSLMSDDPSTLQMCLGALGRINRMPTTPEQTRMAIVAGLKLSREQQSIAVNLLNKWAGASSLGFFQSWYKGQYPQEPAAELARAKSTVAKHSYDQLYNYLEKDPKGKAGDVERGKKAFAKANCLKCHRFGAEGQGVGPDLTSVRRRFQRKEILESLLEPSRVISDQYKTVTVVTHDGLVYTGMPVPQPDPQKIQLLLPNATRLDVAKSEIETTKPSKLSVMPEGILNDLTLEEIADLFSLLETSKFNAEPTPAGQQTTAAGR